jgi:hypothetical protein
MIELILGQSPPPLALPATLDTAQLPQVPNIVWGCPAAFKFDVRREVRNLRKQRRRGGSKRVDRD